jgi:hypothetical protein
MIVIPFRASGVVAIGQAGPSGDPICNLVVEAKNKLHSVGVVAPRVKTPGAILGRSKILQLQIVNTESGLRRSRRLVSIVIRLQRITRDASTASGSVQKNLVRPKKL